MYFEDDLQEVLNDETISKEDKVKIINSYFDSQRDEIDKELRNYLIRKYLGAAVEIGSAALPMGASGKIGTEAVRQFLIPKLGRKVAENVASGIPAGAVSGGVMGFGEGIQNDEHPIIAPIAGAVGGTAAGVLTGGLIGGAGAKAERFLKGQNLKSYGNIDNLPYETRKQYTNDVKNFYQDYIQGKFLNRDGSKIEFSRKAPQEQLRWNPQQGQNYPDLINDIKNAERLPDSPNRKPDQKPNVKGYEVYQGKNGQHFVEVQKSGQKRFYITKDTPKSDMVNTPQPAENTSTPVSKNLSSDIQPTAEETPTLLQGHVEKNVNLNEGGPTGYAAPPTTFNDVIRQAANKKRSEYPDIFERHKRLTYQNSSNSTPKTSQPTSTGGGGDVHVKGYTRSGGVQVKSYTRRAPN